MNSMIIKELERVVGKSNVLVEREQIQNYLFDETPESVRPKPAADLVLVKPVDACQISHVLELANEHKFPVFPRGGGTGLVGGAVPTTDGVILSMERMKQIDIDKDNMMATAEAGVTLEKLLSTISEASLYFPLHPGDETAQVGGLVATNAGGARAIRHGVMRAHVRGMEVVLPTGQILELGGKLQKNNVGYDLMDLLMGSEGTLAVITRVILRLYPKVAATATMIVPYNTRKEALKSVPMILREGRMPLAIEYVEKDLIEKAAKHIGESWPVKEGNCYLLIMEAESNRDEILSESTAIAEICKNNGSLEPLFSEPRDEQDRILRIRSSIYSTLKPDTADILDTTVPPARMMELIDRVDEISGKYGVYLPIYGHAGDGNLHIHLMKEPEEVSSFIDGLRHEIYDATTSLGGVITGEHGIGRTRLGYLTSSISQLEMDIARKIKRLFDPNNILNPGVKIS